MLKISLFTKLLADLWQKILMRALRATGKTTTETTELLKSNDTPESALGLPGSKWILGCSPGAASEIASMLDRRENINIYDGANNYIFQEADGNLRSWIDVEGSINRDAIDDYWVGYGRTALDPFITNRRMGTDDESNETGSDLDNSAD